MTSYQSKETILMSLSSQIGMTPRFWIFLWLLTLVLISVGVFILPDFFPEILLLLSLGIAVTLYLLSRLEILILILVFLVSNFIPTITINLQVLNINGFDIHDVIILGILVFSAFKSFARRRVPIPWWSVSGPLVAYLIFLLFSTIYSLNLKISDPSLVLGESKILFYFATFFISIWAIRSRTQLRRLIIGLFTIADIVAIFIFVREFTGLDNPFSGWTTRINFPLSQAVGASSSLESVRTLGASHIIIWFMMITAFCLTIIAQKNSRLRLFAFIQFAFLTLSFLFIFTLTQWIAITISIIFAITLLTLKSGNNWAKNILIGLFAITILTGFFIANSQSRTSDQPLIDFFVARENSNSVDNTRLISNNRASEWPIIELEEAIRSIAENPLMGIGLGAIYREQTTLHGKIVGWVPEVNILESRSNDARFTHNNPLILAIKMGILGIIFFIWLCGAFLSSSWKIYMHLSERADSSIVLAITSGFVGLLVLFILQSHMIEGGCVIVIGLMLGLVGSINYINNPKHMSSHVQLRSILSPKLDQSTQVIPREFQPKEPTLSLPDVVISRFSRSLIFTIIQSGISITLLFLEMMVAVRILDPTNFGIVILAILITNFIVVATDFGIKTTIIQSIKRREKVAQEILVTNTLVIRFFTLVCISGLIWFGRDLLTFVESTKVLVSLAPYIILMTLVSSFDELLHGMLHGFLAYRSITISHILRNSTRLFLSLVLLLVFKLDFMALIYSWTISHAVSVLYQYHSLPVPKRINFGKDRPWESLKNGLPIQFTRILRFTLSRLQVVLLMILSGPLSVALFTVSEKIPATIQQLSDSFITIYLPTISTMMAGKKRDQAILLLNSSLRLISFLGALVALIAVLFSEQIIILLFTDKYAESALTFGILSLALQMGLVVKLMGNTLIASGHPEQSIGENLLRTILSFFGNLLLIPYIGFLGSGITKFTANHISNPIHLYLLMKNKFSILITPYITQSILLLTISSLYWWIRPEDIVIKVAIIGFYIVINLTLSTFSVIDFRLLIPRFNSMENSITRVISRK